MKSLLRPAKDFVGRFYAEHRGSVSAYTAIFSIMAIGAGALAFDIGHVAVLRSQTQNRADAGAMAGAAQLDGRTGAQARAAAVAINAMSQTSKIAGDSADLGVSSVTFYSSVSPGKVAATGDEDSRFIEVVLNSKRVDHLLTPVLDPSGTSHSTTVNTVAVAGSDPFICHAPPLMLCDPAEADASLDLSLPANAGRQIQLKPNPSGGAGAWAPGNYGLLALPDGSSGAKDIAGALAAVTPPSCYKLDVSTATGVKTNKVQDGINARFDLPGGLTPPAPNVINFPKDVEIVGDTSAVMGSGNWDLAGYWAAKHAGPLPVDLQDASRYQVYLYELGETFARSGRQTVYPVGGGGAPAGFTEVTPPAASIPTDVAQPDNPDFDGMPSQAVAANGPARRLVKIAVLQCQADNVQGHHEYPTHGNYLEGFITQSVPDAPAGVIYVEVVRKLTTVNDPDYHANVKLVE